MKRQLIFIHRKDLFFVTLLWLSFVQGLLCCKPARKDQMASILAAVAEKKGPVARKDAFFGLHFDLHPQKTDTSLGADITEENIFKLLDRVRPDYVQYDSKGHAGYAGYPTQTGWPSGGRRPKSAASSSSSIIRVSGILKRSRNIRNGRGSMPRESATPMPRASSAPTPTNSSSLSSRK